MRKAFSIVHGMGSATAALGDAAQTPVGNGDGEEGVEGGDNETPVWGLLHATWGR